MSGGNVEHGPEAGRLEEPQVRAMFDRIARVYDRMNSVMTAGLHHHWRRRAVDLAQVAPGDRVVDVACGTGDLSLELARRVGATGQVVGCDFSEQMLELARDKAARAPALAAGVRFEWANALELPYEDGEFAAATVGFGARNFSDLQQGLSEMRRVVRPGGKVVVLEITTPTKPPLSSFYQLWFDRIVPSLGRFAGDSDAYTYLPSSVRRFPGPQELAATLERAGLTRIRYVLTAGGIIATHVGEVPELVATAATLDAVVRAGGPQLGSLMERVEQRLGELTSGYGPLLSEQAGATIAAGGKRLRPLLVLLAAGPATERLDEERLIRSAVAVELIHSASLVHDDVLDRAPTRRGIPTVFAAAGRTAATATGDFLFSRAFAELAGGGEVDDVRALSQASSALAAGELLQREDAWDAGVSLTRYLHRCELKTGALFEAACRLGALAGGGPADALAAFGRAIGLAFQLLDDVLDVSGPVERTGKARGTDLLDGTVTLPLILARERDPRLAALDVRALRGTAEAERVCDQIAATGALADAKQRALAVVAGAKAGLPQALPVPQRATLELVADGVVERYA